MERRWKFELSPKSVSGSWNGWLKNIYYIFFLSNNRSGIQEDSITKNRMDRAAFFHRFINLLFIFNKKEMRYVYHI